MRKKLYGAIDLHSNNSYAVISDGEDRVICEKRLENNLVEVDRFFGIYKPELNPIVVESTYNGYWLIDGLMELGYEMKLANPSQMQPYLGLKHRDDSSDTLWLNRMHRLGVLPEGYIYPQPERGMRDLLRKRLFLVRLRTSLINSLKHQYQTWQAEDVNASEIKKLSTDEVKVSFKDDFVRQGVEALRQSMQVLSAQISGIEASLKQVLQEDALVNRLQLLPGIGKLLAWTIRLEIGELARFKEDFRPYLSYCGLVESKQKSNEKLKGHGNRKNRNRYLRWAYGEAAIAALKYPKIRAYHDRLVKKKGKVKAKAILSSKLARVSFMMMQDPGMIYTQEKLWG
jgi:transposase